jgi:RNA polymerase sigma factor (sigma-70 family)
MTEEKAIHLCLKHHDPSGFEFLVRQFRREAFYHAQAWLPNESDAADAVQESFAAAFAAMPRLTQLDRFYPWFYRILRNRCLNFLARERVRNRYREEQLQVAGEGDSKVELDESGSRSRLRLASRTTIRRQFRPRCRGARQSRYLCVRRSRSRRCLVIFHSE